MTPEELAAQQQQDALSPAPVQIPEDPSFLSTLNSTLFDATQQSSLTGTPVTDVEGNALPTPEAAPALPEVTPHDVATARQLNDANVQPEMVDKKVGEEKSTSTQQVQSDASRQAQSEIGAAQAAEHAATQMELKSVQDQANVDADIKKADNDVIAQVETARAATQANNQVKFQNALSEIDGKVAELANYKPETFWGSKSTADKIGASISVGLGSFAQAVMGSGQNVGTMLLNRQMDEFDTSQKAQYQNKLNQIQNMRASLNEKEQLADKLDKTFDAQKLAARAQVQSQFAKASAMAKTPQVQAAIMQKQAAFDRDVGKIHEEIASKYEQKISTTTEKDVIQHVKLQPGMGKDGKPLKLTDGNAKARIAMADIIAGNKGLQGIDLEKVSQSPAFQTYLESKNNETNLSQVPFAGQTLVGVGNLMSGTDEEYLAKTDPVAAQAANAMDSWTRGVIRYKSGAAIAHKEQNEERNQYWPSLGDTPATLKEKADARTEIEKAMREAGAL